LLSSALILPLKSATKLQRKWAVTIDKLSAKLRFRLQAACALHLCITVAASLSPPAHLVLRLVTQSSQRPNKSLLPGRACHPEPDPDRMRTPDPSCNCCTHLETQLLESQLGRTYCARETGRLLTSASSLCTVPRQPYSTCSEAEMHMKASSQRFSPCSARCPNFICIAAAHKHSPLRLPEWYV
jgi:hypothetical protein